VRGFWSYARNDNKSCKISILKDAFEQTLIEVTGDEVDIYMDTTHIHWGEEWENAIKSNIAISDFFIAILSPSYFKRHHCLLEFELAIQHNVGIFPLYYRKTPDLEGEENKKNEKAIEIASAVAKMQYRDFRPLRNKIIASEEAQNFLDLITEELANEYARVNQQESL